MRYRAFRFSFVFLFSCLFGFGIFSTSLASNVTSYVTSWSGYGIGNLAYPFDGSYIN